VTEEIEHVHAVTPLQNGLMRPMRGSSREGRP
jgi:hypothetical protein